MKKVLGLILAVAVVGWFGSCSRMAEMLGEMTDHTRDRQEYRDRDYGYDYDDDYDDYDDWDDSYDDVDPEPIPEYTFDESIPFFEFGEEKRDIAYDGNLYNDIYNYGEDLTSEQIAALDLSSRTKPVVEGEFLNFLTYFITGADPLVEARAVTVNGEDQPYRCLYVRLYYPDTYFTNDLYSDIYDWDYETLLHNCDQLLIENGIDTLIFSMYNNGDSGDEPEMQVITVTSQKNWNGQEKVDRKLRFFGIEQFEIHRG